MCCLRFFSIKCLNTISVIWPTCVMLNAACNLIVSVCILFMSCLFCVEHQSQRIPDIHREIQGGKKLIFPVKRKVEKDKRCLYSRGLRGSESSRAGGHRCPEKTCKESMRRWTANMSWEVIWLYLDENNMVRRNKVLDDELFVWAALDV